MSWGIICARMLGVGGAGITLGNWAQHCLSTSQHSSSFPKPSPEESPSQDRCSTQTCRLSLVCRSDWKEQLGIQQLSAKKGSHLHPLLKQRTRWRMVASASSSPNTIRQPLVAPLGELGEVLTAVGLPAAPTIPSLSCDKIWGTCRVARNPIGGGGWPQFWKSVPCP